jgi:hypothetical protein
MLTFFTTAKPFVGHDGIIQRNALKSWKLLDPDVEVILFGDEEGAAEVCADYGLRHEPYIERFGKIPYVDVMFARAQEIARHNFLCFSNCDIIFLQDFREAFRKATMWRERFLLVSRRWDIDIRELIDFTGPNWAGDLRRLALTSGVQRDGYWIDFFLFRKGLFLDMPSLMVGYCYWDNWMIWKACSMGIPVLDATSFMVPVHQNHGYSAESQRIKGASTDARSMWNLQSIGDKTHFLQIDAATHRMARNGWIHRRVLRNNSRKAMEAKRFLTYKLWLPVWHFLLAVTRPMRNMLGLTSKRLR